MIAMLKKKMLPDKDKSSLSTFSGEHIFSGILLAILALKTVDADIGSHNMGGGTKAVMLRRFEYKHSFRIPNLSQRDGTIPFWSVQGDATASGEQLRLAPSMRSRRGIAWNKRAMVESDHWELDVAFKITGQGRIGADGLAIWYTAQQGSVGPVFGANDFWTGMGILLDSFDNDGQRNNPSISLMINDGTRSFDHTTDGSAQILSSCQRDFRNKQYPVQLRITYLDNILTVLITDGLSPQPRYELCIRAENIYLPKNGYFGVSAATGGLADDHDVVEFSAYSLFTDAQQIERSRQISEEERRKYDAEFQRQQQDFDEERKKFKEQHPEKAREDDDELAAKVYEDASSRELRFIHESQAAIHRVLQQVELKLQEISQQQRSQLATIQQQQQQQTGVGGAVQQATGVGVPSFSPAEKAEVLQSLREIGSELRTIKQYASEIFTRTYSMEQKMGSSASGQATGGSGLAQDQSIRTYFEQMQQEIRTLRVQQQSAGQTLPVGMDCPSCLGTNMFYVVVAIQSLVILLVIYVRSKSEKAKFY